ncbi:hypothetical protein KI387_017722, partial [Taxus chinensis]
MRLFLREILVHFMMWGIDPIRIKPSHLCEKPHKVPSHNPLATENASVMASVSPTLTMSTNGGIA